MTQSQLTLRWIFVIIRGLLFSIIAIVFYTPMVLLLSATQKKKKLHEAAWGNDLNTLQAGLNDGESIDVKDRDGYTALHIASLKGHEAITRALVDRGASLDIRSSNGLTPLDIASIHSHEAIAEFLISRGAETNLLTYVAQGNTEVVRDYLSAGENPNANPGGLGTLLHVAVKRSHRNVVQALLESGANVNVESSRDTPLDLAIQNGDLQLVQFLIENGARINVQSERRTPLHRAVSSGNFEIVQYLVEHEADVNARDEFPSGQTPLHYAVGMGRADIVGILLAAGADVHTGNWLGGITPLALAKHHPAVMEVIEQYHNAA